jgi:hypothetical protein
MVAPPNPLSLSVNGLGGHDLQTYCFYGAR